MTLWWTIGFVGAGAVVVVVAVLGLLILHEARRIRRLAAAAAEVVGEIDANTRSIWALQKTNATAATLLEGASAIEGNARRIEGIVAGGHGTRDAA